MTDETRSRAYQLLKAAGDMPQADADQFLAERSAEEPEAAGAAARMLARSRVTGDFALPNAITFGEWARDRKGTTVGDWHIGDLLAPGGFGRVYRARRRTAGGEHEEVAIKFLDMLPDQVERFLRERQTLADLNHEGICKFIDGGTTPDGTPYMVMEYVAGLPITIYCDEHSLSVAERLKLFVKLCHAVEYAHQQRVLHRDLKPANVLVTRAGAVRVIDFGIARLLDPVKAGSERLTMFGESIWTRTHASPEQVIGGDLTLSTDVYGLGVVLYELLSGQLPFSESALSGPDWAGVIAEQEPLPPSQASLVERSDESYGGSVITAEDSAHLRGTSPRRLKRKLAGNLDAIVMNTLRKAPDQRYRRVERLRSDIELVLEGLPVTVRNCGLWERVRNRAVKCPVAATLIVASFLSVAYPFSRGFPGQIEDRVALHELDDALLRLQGLAERGLPRIEDSIPSGPENREVRLLTARIHTRLLQSIEVLPDYTLRELDNSLVRSALRCAEEWRNLADPGAALAVTAPVLPRAATRYESDRRDRQRRDLYSQLLKQRVEMHRWLKQEAEAADEARLLQEIEARHP